MQQCTHAPYVCLQGNVKETQYDVDFFRSFSLVLNGLDNLEARRHVNRLCLAAETPLVESGTTGYLGQVGSQTSTCLCRVMGLARCEMQLPGRTTCSWVCVKAVPLVG